MAASVCDLQVLVVLTCAEEIVIQGSSFACIQYSTMAVPLRQIFKDNHKYKKRSWKIELYMENSCCILYACTRIALFLLPEDTTTETSWTLIFGRNNYVMIYYG
jgi:lysylphosphatidylglycerol synthetase-like protein (DUF2156 family)